MNVPDFAFPKTVMEDSRKSLNKALSEDRPVDALRAFMNLTIASAEISNERITSLLSELDSINLRLPSPINAMGYLLEAQIYYDIYNSNRWIIDQRTVTEGMAEENPLFWDRSLFENKINSLISLALSEKKEASDFPLQKVAALIDYNGSLKSFTLYDFIVYEIIRLTRHFDIPTAIPFYETATPQFSRRQLIDELLQLHPSPSEARVTALILSLEFIPADCVENYLWEEMRKMGPTPEAANIAVTIYEIYFGASGGIGLEEKNTKVSAREFFNFVKELRGKINNTKGRKELDRIMECMQTTEVELNYPTLASTSSEIEIKTYCRNLPVYYILVLKLNDNTYNRYSIHELQSLTKKIQFHEMITQEPLPFRSEDTLKISIKEPGDYILVASLSPEIKDVIMTNRYFYPNILEISDIDIIGFDVKGKTNEFPPRRGCFVVNAAQGAPLQGVPVRFEAPRNPSLPLDPKIHDFENTVTDSVGYATADIENPTIYATFQGNKARLHTGWIGEVNDGSRLKARIFTDQAVYRPGDVVRFLGIALETENSEGSLAKRREIDIRVQNANWATVDTLKFLTDDTGRFVGEYTLPKDGLLGGWRLVFNTEACDFQVSDYKTASLFVTLEQELSTKAGWIEFKGKASTYSGMPVAGAKVQFLVKYSPLRFFRNGLNTEQTYSSEVDADENGEFKVTLPLANLDSKDYNGIFTINASVTDAAGETANSPSEVFWLGQSYNMSAAIPSMICADEIDAPFKVAVTDMSGLPVIKQVEYIISHIDGVIVSEGKFESPAFTMPDLPSGEYEIKFALIGEEADTTSYRFILYRDSDSCPPVRTALWVPKKQYIAVDNEKTVPVTFGSSFEGQNVLVIVSDSEGNEEYHWIVSAGKNSTVEISKPAANVRKFVTFCTIREHEYYNETVTVIPEAQMRKLKIVTETFRETLAAGQIENWKFRLLYDEEPVRGYAYALLYDKALDAVSPLRWNSFLFTPSFPCFVVLSGRGVSITGQRFRNHYPENPNFSISSFSFQTYGHGLYYSDYPYITGTRAYMKMTPREDMNMEFATNSALTAMDTDDMATSVEEESAMEGSIATANENENVEFRPVEMPVAFFLPDLESNEENDLEISFTVPNYNTTWNFIMGAYIPTLVSTSIELQTVASKKVMVKMLSPRFLRTGDMAVLTATIYNNSVEDREIWGEFEIFNPVTGEPLESVTSETSMIAPSGNKTISVEFHCPYNLNVLGLRVYAKSEESSDGEQTVIPVLPSSQPIIESDSFYIPAGQESFTFRLPEMREGSSVTFKYCDNPIWSVITALPPIVTPESDALTAKIAALYANCVGLGIMKSNNKIREGLALIVNGEAGDSLLVSNLEKDIEFKTVSLGSTPWVNDAINETIRLSRLGTLLDATSGERIVEDLWEKILELRNLDGGWSWCKGMKSSRWMTEAVLLNVGLLRQGGYLPEIPGMAEVIEKAIAFVETSYVMDYEEIGDHKLAFYSSLLPYLYIRSFFQDIAMNSGMRDIKRKALSHLDSDWEDLSVFYKATAAITLWREGHRMTAREILESLRQFTSESLTKGVWFDNLDSGWNGAGKLLTTARALLAFHEIQPGDSIVDRMRQWMLIQRQGQDWQEGLWSVDVIDALLTTGSDWTGEYEAPQISVGNDMVTADRIARLTGEVTVNLSTAEEGREIQILRHSTSPAWGGAIIQFIEPMNEVEAATIEVLSISKEIWRIVEDENGVRAEKPENLAIGDKIRITMIIECGRDMDFVALTDERPACVEPTEQLSGYTSSDGLWFYRETRNNATNLFFDFMPRGRHIVSYECRVMEEGDFSSGIATLQCLYSPLLTAHSAGEKVRVR